MGEKQRKKQRKKQKKKQRYIRNIRASKPSPIASPGTMTPVPISFPGDDTTLSPKVDGTTGCAHVERGVKLEKVRTRFQTKPLPQCQSCTRSRPSKAQPGAKKDLWICLACGYVGCGWHSHDAQDSTPLSLGSGHIRAHRKQLTHPIVMQWGDSLDCWCLDCDIQLMYPADVATSTRSTLLRKAAALLQESISRQSSTLLKVESGQVELGQAESDHADPGPSESGQPDPGVVAEQQPSKFAARPFVSRRVIKGLTNLGNTCFFNSVMQNLVGVSMLREHFRQESSVQEGVLKKSLRTFFQDMDPPGDGADGGSGRTIHTRSFGSSVGTAVSPRVLFSAICTKAPRFKGFQQQDSHELLRCLLDGLHMEEESMRKSVVGSHGPEDGPAKVPGTFVEHMFGMQLSSTVSCCECGHSSVVYEPYLDLSLPIPSKQERSKSESIRVQLPKLIAPRSHVGTASGSGVSSVHPAPSDSGLVDSTQPSSVSDPEHARPAPVHGCSLGPFSVLDGGAVNSGSLHDAVEKQVACTSGDGEGSMVQGSADSPSTPSRCEVVSEAGGAAAACSSGSGESKGWLDFVGDTSQGMAGESAAMSFLDQRVDSSASGAPASDASEAFGIGGFSGSRVEEIVDHSSGDMFSVQGGRVREALDDGNPMEEETIEYGPQLPGAGYRVEQQSECLELVIFRPDASSLPSALTDPSCLDGTSSGSREVSSSSDPKSGALVPAEDDGDFGGVASLFDDGNSFSRGDPSSPYHFGSASPSFSPFDSIVSVPSFPSDLGQIFGGRAVPVGGVREVEPYPIMSLEGCLQAFTKTEVLSGENAWGCENCTRLVHGPLRDPDPSEEAMDTNGSIDLADTDGEFEPRSASVGTSAVDATREAVDVEGDGTHGEWESLVVEDRVMEDLSASTNSLSIVVVPQARDASAETSNNGYSMFESSPHESADAEQTASPRMGSDGGGGSSSAALGPAVVPPLSKSHNTLKRSQSLDCFADSSSAKGSEFPPSRSSNENENAEEPYVLVESSSVSADAVEDDTASRNGRRRRNNTGVSSKEAQGRPGKVCGRGVEACAKPGAKASPKLVTVKRDATKRFLISKAPLVLTVHLKRFAQDLHGRLSKLSGHITFHEQLDLGPFVDQRDGVKGDGVYQLIGTVEHSGTMRGGHYVAYVKGLDSSSVEPGAEPSSDGGSTWYYISDSHVRKTSLESVLQSEAYLLFYERRTFE